MKNINLISIILICSLLFITSCENDDIEPKELDDSLFWVSFTSSNLSTVESSPNVLIAQVGLSASSQNTDVPITYSVSSPDAEEGIDYTLPADFGSAVIAAGEHFVEIELATLINDDIVEGDKTLIFTLESAGSFNIGLPGTQTGNSFTLIIKEDDFSLIAYTSFEEPFGGTGYTDLVTNDVDHDLVNNPGDASVDFVSTGGELGFNATFISTRVFTAPNGLADEAIGVLNAPNLASSFTDGVKGYSFSDTDGIFRVTFDAVDLSGFTTQVFVSLDLYLNDTGYEITTSPVTGDPEADNLSIYAIVDGGEKVDMIDLIAEGVTNEINDFNKGEWQELTLDLTGFSTAQLVIDVDVSSNTEGASIDNIQFLGL